MLQVLVMNNRPEAGAHPVFEALVKRVADGDPAESFVAKARLYVSFLRNPGTVPDPAPDAPEPNDFDNPDNRPGRFLTLLRMTIACTRQPCCCLLVPSS